MADKEATVFVIDLGASMGKATQGRQLNNLEWSMQYVWDKILAKVLTGRKTDMVGIVGFRTNRTDNILSSEESYHNIEVLMPIQQMLMPHIRSIQKLCVPNKGDKGDAISALVVGVDLIMRHCKHLKYIKNIVLITDGQGVVDWSGSDDIARQIRQQDIKLSIFGVDFDDPEFGFKEEGKSARKKENEKEYENLVKATKATFATMAEVISSVEFPRVRKVRPVPSYRGRLTIGDPDKYDDAISIEVERYPRTKKAAAQSASKYVAPQDSHGKNEAIQGGSVALQRTYKIKRDDEEIEVEKEELDKAYLYGRTIVNISDADQSVTKLDTTAELTIIGFIEQDGFKRYMSLSESNCIIAQKGSRRAQIALSSLIHALYENDLIALARLVTKDDKPPVIIAMAPSIETEIECLVDVQVPFAEDVRHYTFAPLDKVVTLKGKVLTKHRNLPTEEQDEAMSEYVDSMNLENYAPDDQGGWPPREEIYSPVLHRINQVIKHRALYPGKPLPPPTEVLVKYSTPPEDLVKGSEKVRTKMIEAFNVKKVPPRKLAKRKKEDEIKPISGLDIESILSRGGESSQRSEPKRLKLEGRIGSDDPAKDFKKLIDDEENSFSSVFKEMESVIKDVIRKSYADTSYDKALKALQAYRSEAIDLDEPRQFNAYLQSLKEDLLNGNLNGNRRDFWTRMKSEKLGLITYEESEVDQIEGIGEADVKQFFKD